VSIPILPDPSPDVVQTDRVTVPKSPRRGARKGAQFEQQIAEWLADRLQDDRIERRVKNGRNDRGDIGGVRTIRGGRVVIEAKNQNRLSLAEWVDEAVAEAGNDDAVVGVVVHKRRGKGAAQFGDTYVTMTLDAFAHLIEGGVDL
jgi:hypothetical protein